MNIEESVRTAVEAAESAPEKIRQATFTEVLRHLLDGGDVVSTAPRSNSVTASRPMTQNTAIPAWGQKLIAELPEAHVIAESDSRTKHAVWAAITLWSEGDAVTTDSVRKVIRETLGVTPSNGANTSTTLKKLMPKYLTREKQGKGYTYTPTVRASDVFNEPSKV